MVTSKNCQIRHEIFWAKFHFITKIKTMPKNYTMEHKNFGAEEKMKVSVARLTLGPR